MIPLTALVAVAVFLFRIVPVTSGAVETAVQQALIRLFKTFFSIQLRSILMLITSAVPVYAADAMGWVSAGIFLRF